ncbi:helix-turn-helix domain-containing protein [Aquibacillus salsiterrae]|uniref:Helix-turn-helix domain-containing protein n=1 Tax=Aquibacillus salsiterrae TaxID=2950439 RepID=A0A9X4AF07_9BACI|nr:helix-turn-helix domain-containing protein [Aquibacillus salsiterrae]MDC3417502.1 helix-turn-helix domain-containing protein [Aquibacillus salsiterrae]
MVKGMKLMEIGPLIKLHRIKQNMKQEDLAKGIVSESYLSKIENNKTNANPKVIDMLCNRLGIKLDDEVSQSQIIEQCKKWFNLLFEFNDIEEMKRQYQKLKVLISKNVTPYNTLFEIHKIRYYLLTDDISKATEQVAKLKELKATFSEKELYYWYKFIGDGLCDLKDYQQGIHYYKLAEEKLTDLDLPEFEVADLNYQIGVANNNVRNSMEVIEYINEALKYYRKYYNLARCSRGHLLLGIAYRRIYVFDKAIENFNLAMELAEINNDEEVTRLIYINLGHLYTAKQEPKQVEYYFQKVLDDQKATTRQKLISICALSEQYFFAHEIDKKKEMIQYGLAILNQESNKEEYRFFELKLYTYHYAIEEQFDKFESIVMNEFIPFLEQEKDYVGIVTYGKMIGQYFEDLKKYKYATRYYKLVNTAYEKMIQL